MVGIFSSFSMVVSLALALSAPFAMPTKAETLSVFRGDIDAAIYVPLGDLEYISIPSGFCEMAIADPQIANIAAETATLVRVDGISAGRTSITIFDCADGIDSIVEILVPANGLIPNGKGPFYVPAMLYDEQIPVVKNVAVATLMLHASASVMLETDLSVTAFVMGNLNIADAANLEETGFYILGKTVGKTTMLLQHEDGIPPTILHIEVVGDTHYGS